MKKSIKPEDILSDDESIKIIDGVPVRKGTIAAVMANAKILSDSSISPSEKSEALKTIKEYAPALVVLGVYEHMKWNNPEIQKIVEEAARKLGKFHS